MIEGNNDRKIEEKIDKKIERGDLMNKKIKYKNRWAD